MIEQDHSELEIHSGELMLVSVCGKWLTSLRMSTSRPCRLGDRKAFQEEIPQCMISIASEGFLFVCFLLWGRRNNGT